MTLAAPTITTVATVHIGRDQESWLGHAQTSITADLLSHVSVAMKLRAAAMGAVMGRQVGLGYGRGNIADPMQRTRPQQDGF